MTKVKKKIQSKKEMQKAERLKAAPSQKIEFTDEMATSLINNEEHNLCKRKGKMAWKSDKKDKMLIAVLKCKSMDSAVEAIAKLA